MSDLKNVEIDEIEFLWEKNFRNAERYSDEKYQALYNSIIKDGIKEPLIVALHPNEDSECKYIAIAGHRRGHAVKKIKQIRKLDEYLVPVRVRREVKAENIQQEIVLHQLNNEPPTPIEFAQALNILVESGLSHREISARVGSSEKTIDKTLKLLNLPQNIQEKIEKQEMSVSNGYTTAEKMEQFRKYKDKVEKIVEFADRFGAEKTSTFKEGLSKTLKAIEEPTEGAKTTSANKQRSVAKRLEKVKKGTKAKGSKAKKSKNTDNLLKIVESEWKFKSRVQIKTTLLAMIQIGSSIREIEFIVQNLLDYDESLKEGANEESADILEELTDAAVEEDSEEEDDDLGGWDFD